MTQNKQKFVELENKEWLESLDDVYRSQGSDRDQDLLGRLTERARKFGVQIHQTKTTPYVNTIPVDEQPPYPGRREIEHRIKNVIRWNVMAMVVKANREEKGIGGHIFTYALAATLFEVAFNHFLRAKNKEQEGDIVYFQGHASQGIYARAFLEGRLSGFDVGNFRRELKNEGGLPSYPHPRLRPDFWQFPTVSMVLSPIMAIYQVANCYMGKVPMINSSGPSGKNDVQQVIKTAVINKRAGGTGLITGCKAFQKSMKEGVELLNAVQEVYLEDRITVA